MDKNLTQAYKHIGEAFEKHIKNTEIGAIYMAVAPDGTMSVAYSGTPEQQYTAIAHFLFEHPDTIELFQAAVDCATEFHKQTKPKSNQFLN